MDLLKHTEHTLKRKVFLVTLCKGKNRSPNTAPGLQKANGPSDFVAKLDGKILVKGTPGSFGIKTKEGKGHVIKRIYTLKLQGEKSY